MTSLDGRVFAGVLFDNDGTLIDSLPAAARAWVTWAGEYDVPLSSMDGLHGLPARDIVARLAPDADPVVALHRIVELEESDTDGVVALPGAADALTATGARGAIVTSATGGLALARLAAAGLPRPGAFVSADDITRGKPDPEPFLLGAEHLGVDPTQCLVVEDAPSGLQAARAAGCATIALTTTTPASDLQADLVVENLAQVRFEQVPGGLRVHLR